MLLAEIQRDYYVSLIDRFQVYKTRENAPAKRPSNYFDGVWTVEGCLDKLIRVSNGDKNMLVPGYYLKKLCYVVFTCLT